MEEGILVPSLDIQEHRWIGYVLHLDGTFKQMEKAGKISADLA